MKTTNTNLSTNLRQRYAVPIVALLVITISPAYAEQLTSGVSFAQISFTASNPPEKYSHYGQISVDYTMLYSEGYVNVERYENGQATGWVVKNLPVVNGAVLSGFSTIFDLGTSGYRSTFSAYMDFSPTPLADDTSLKGQVDVIYQLGQAEYPLADPDNQGSGANLFWSGKECDEPTPIKKLPFQKQYSKGKVGVGSQCFKNATGETIRLSIFYWIPPKGVQQPLTCDDTPFWAKCGPGSGVDGWHTVQFDTAAVKGETAGIENNQIFSFNVMTSQVTSYYLEFTAGPPAKGN
jgi:hypothetical protein